MSITKGIRVCFKPEFDPCVAIYSWYVNRLLKLKPEDPKNLGRKIDLRFADWYVLAFEAQVYEDPEQALERKFFKL